MASDGWLLRQRYAQFLKYISIKRLVVSLLLAGTVTVSVCSAVLLATFEDVGYPDSATLLRVKDFSHSGRIYPPFDEPPYLVTLYGPLTYVFFGVAYRLAEFTGMYPPTLVRVSLLGVVCLDIILLFLISRKLNHALRSAWLCLLFALSVSPLASWTTQIRGDFPATGFSLLSVYLLLLPVGSNRAVASAICAGIAMLFKQTFIAAPVTIIFWLVYRKQFKDVGYFITCLVFTVAGGYLLFWWREPLMIEHIAAIRSPVFEFRGAVDIISKAVSQPVIPFFMLGILLALRDRASEWLFFLWYSMAAWVVAIASIPQVGGNINYFWEPLWASAVLAGPAFVALEDKLKGTSLLVTAMLGILLTLSFLPFLAEHATNARWCIRFVHSYQIRKAKWDSLMSVVSGRRLLSTYPALATQSITPEIPDPFLNALLERQGQWNSGPVVSGIEAGLYELIIVERGSVERRGRSGYRGVSAWGDRMWISIKSHYTLACEFDDMEVWVPREGSNELVFSLSSIGCSPPARGTIAKE